MEITNTIGLQKKTQPRYLGPYRVDRRTQGGSYILCELDGTRSRRGVAAFRLIPYIRRPNFDLPEESLGRIGLREEEEIVESDEEDN